MSGAPKHPLDPIGWSALIALAFLVLAAIRLTIPSAEFFDEVHYLPAARALIEAVEYPNPEHPLLGKQIIAAGILIFGDTPLGWRIFPLIFGTIALFAAMRALWFASLNRFATLAYGFLLVTGFLLFINSRIAILDIFMLAFLMLAFWHFAAAMRQPETGRWRLAASGIALGLAMGAKWNAVPIAPLFGLTFLAVRFRAGRRRLLTSKRGAPVPGVSLIEAAVWLGALPLAVYAATFWPGYLVENGPLVERGLIGFHQHIFHLQSTLTDGHPYQSQWWQWMLNLHGIWYLYEVADGAQRGVFLIGNPLTMLLGLPAIIWAGWVGIFRGRNDAFAVMLLYVVSLGFWIIAAKPTQFYFHYMLPSMFLLAALALALDDLRLRGWDWLAGIVLAGSACMFAWFWPVLSAAELDNIDAYQSYTWLEDWV